MLNIVVAQEKESSRQKVDPVSSIEVAELINSLGRRTESEQNAVKDYTQSLYEYGKDNGSLNAVEDGNGQGDEQMSNPKGEGKYE